MAETYYVKPENSPVNDVTLNAPIKLRLNTSLDYSNGNRTSESSDSTWRDITNLTPLGGRLNRTYNEGLSRYRTLNFNNFISYYKKLPWGDNISVSLYTSYNRSKPSESFSRSLTEYLQTGDSDYRDRYTDSHSDSYSYTLQGNYTISLLNGWRISPRADYRQTYSSSHNMSYRLDWLSSIDNGQLTIATKANQNYQLSTINSQLPIGWLPSNELLLSVLDTDNSDTHTHFERTYGGGIIFSRQLGDDEGWLSFDFPLHSVHERMHYVKEDLDTIAHRTNLMFEPSFSWYRWGKNFKMVQTSRWCSTACRCRNLTSPRSCPPTTQRIRWST